MLWFLVLSVAICQLTAAEASTGQRIVGGEVTTIDRYPFQAGILMGGIVYEQHCGSSILNTRSILTAAHCFRWSLNPASYRIRVGSSYAHSGGVVHNTQQLILHPSYNWWGADNDVAIVRSAAVISFNNVVQPASIAGSNYNVADNQAVWAVGWGLTSWQGAHSEQLRHVQLWTINQDICRTRYAELNLPVTDNMLCSGWLDVGGRDQCTGDSGGPLIHNGVVVGVCSWGEECALPRYPGVNARVSRFTTWIQANA